MKSIYKKLNISLYTFFFLGLSFFSGYLYQSLILLLIIIFHECGHVLFFTIFKVDILSITIYPFGGITKVNKKINFPINKELMIAFAGVLFQFMLFIIIYILTKQNLLSIRFYETFIFYNKTIAFFNLLPIIPLDGSVILRSLLELKIPYYYAAYFYWIISFFCLIVFCIYYFEILINNLIIILFLFYKLKENITNFNYVYNQFLLERWLNNFKYKKIIYNSSMNVRLLRKDCYHYFKSKNICYAEKTLLNKKFDNVLNFW